MPAADFPNSPSVGQSFTVDNKTYEWNGTYWEMAISTATIADGSIEGVKLADMGASAGDFLGWDGTEWGPDQIDLGTDTTGNYMVDVSAGTGITVTHTPSEGSTATIGLDADLGDLNDVTITTATTGDALVWNGSAWINDALDSGSIGDFAIVAPEQYQTLVYDGTNWINEYPTTVSLVNNAESTTLQVGEAVYLFGNVGNHASVKRADNDGDATSAKTVGIVAEAIPAGGTGPVVTRGYVYGMNLTAYTAGQTLYLGENGGFTTTKPYAPEHLVYLGVVVRATSNGIIYVATQNGYELDEIHDVDLITTAPTSGDFLKYNGTLWVNDKINLGTDTDGNYVSGITAGTGVTVTHTPSEGSSPTIAIGQAVNTDSNVQFNDVTVDGNLTVNGTTTTLNTETLAVEDNIVVLNNGVTGSPTTNAGIEVERGTSTNVMIRWNETTDKWQFTNDGSTYQDFGSGGGVTVSSTEPVSPQSGDLWFDSDTAQTFVYYDSSWVEVGAVSGTASLLISATAPATPAEGDLWFDSDTGATYVYYSSSWIEVGAAPFDALVNRFDAKGDLLVGLADNSLTTLPVGQDGYFLQANSSASAGVQWTSVSTDFMTSTKNAAIITMEIGA